jgi:hypothetical protein
MGSSSPAGVRVGRGWVFGGPAHAARGPDGILHDAWPTTSAVRPARRRLHHEALPQIVDQVRRGDAYLVVRERVAGPTLRRLVDVTVQQGARLEPAWALALLTPIADLLARPERARLPARVGPDAVIVDVDGLPRFVGFEHWAPVTPLLPSLAFGPDSAVEDDSFALTGTLFMLLTGQSPTPEREQLGVLQTRLAVVDDPTLRAALTLLCAKNLQNRAPLRQTTLECLHSLEHAARLASPVDTATLAAVVAGLFPDEVAAERTLRDEP